MIGPEARNSEPCGRFEEGFGAVCNGCEEVSAADTVTGGVAGDVVHAMLAAIPSEIRPTENTFFIKRCSRSGKAVFLTTDNPRGLTIRTNSTTSTKSTSPGGET